MDRDMMIGILKAAAWERAKGALREVATLEGQRRGGAYERLDREVEGFVSSIENEGLHE